MQTSYNFQLRRGLNHNFHTAKMTEPALKRRKLRKGTQSCWECKRRKTRCTFVSPRESVCDGCRSREVQCVSQEFCEENEENTTPRSVQIDVNGKAPPLTHDATKGNDGQAMHHALLDVWPSPTELEDILDMSTNTSILFHGLICIPYSELIGKDIAAHWRRDILLKPSPDVHPVTIARKLLLLGTFLQGNPRDSIKRLNTTSHLLVETASRLVTSQDDLIASLEGIECLMMEAMFHNNAGNIRRAWLTHRRAIAIAQMMGLHRDSSYPQPKAIEPDSQANLNPEHMWFRLVITDRYLSLMLGLPQASPESPFCSPSALASCNPLERMERLESLAGGRILQRTNPRDLALTHEIDKLLQDAAAIMPPQWWLLPSIPDIAGDGTQALTETLRLMNQFTHYHLLAQLHLPYLLHPSDERKYDYSKTTAVTASREILVRFVAFRGSASPAAAYCRGVDFLAFIASTLLTLAHVEARRRQREVSGGYVLDFLAHQRQGDRGLLERTVECMENMAKGDGDVMATKVSEVLRQLLAVEAGATEGVVYCANVGSEETGEVESSGLGEDKVLRIHIPYFGIVKIEEAEGLPLVRKGSTGTEADPVGYQIGGEPVNSDWQQVPDHGNATDEGLLVPCLTAEVDDWVLQGVDMALFDNLIWGATATDGQGG
ncbi:hypothetical protein B0T16DRAFT_402194 [Cercophora newfieldiana]|uniref:Zn(2)-C6 fungal-type domain-containing protein n=1 Tax=Cercophora newfieldiana TaxID=92897 RepID=A0AA39YS46_9PEZI|nr:hypothetical protein B0T16DRAFT_402194 [Cercophora newfieldiana]